MECEFTKYFPQHISSVIEQYLQVNNQLEEIRVRSGRPVILKFSQKEIVTNVIASYQNLIDILQKICDNSIYSYQSEICSGYVTVKGGHRVGIVGNVIMDSKKIININYISGLNFRIARELIGCSNNTLKHILNLSNNSIYNTLIVSPPGVR